MHHHEFTPDLGLGVHRSQVRMAGRGFGQASVDLADKQSALIEGPAHGSTGRALNFLLGDNDDEHTARACYEPDIY